MGAVVMGEKTTATATVLGGNPVLFSGRVFREGDEIEHTIGALNKSLFLSGNLVIKGAAKVEPVEDSPLDAETVDAGLFDADDMTAAGIPSVDAMAKVLGHDVTAKERDQIWALSLEIQG